VVICTKVICTNIVRKVSYIYSGDFFYIGEGEAGGVAGVYGGVQEGGGGREGGEGEGDRRRAAKT
jgi:hypothetical protein